MKTLSSFIVAFSLMTNIFGQIQFVPHNIADMGGSVFPIDMEDDGDMDVLSSGSIIVWHENDGNGNFIVHTINENGANSIYAIDMDGDGDVDVLSSGITWYENDGNENFIAHTINESGANSVYAIDVDSDGDIDVVSAEGSEIAWYENDGSENFTSHTITTTAFWAQSVYAIDLDGDGDIDILSGHDRNPYNTVTWYENNGNDHFTPHNMIPQGDLCYSVYATDLDGDGDIDVLTALTDYDDGNGIGWYENDGNENFIFHTIPAGAQEGYSVYAADLDSDGDVDVLCSYSDWDFVHNIAWYENDGNENFTKHLITYDLSSSHSLFAVDIDSDNNMDVLSSGAWYENDGIGIYNAHTINYYMDWVTSAYAIDMDGDKDIDLLAVAEYEGDFFWFENDGNENFALHIIIANANGGRSVFAIDMEGDGDIDVLLLSDEQIDWYENDGNENFTAHTITTDMEAGSSIYAEDIDGDNDMDVLAASNFDSKIDWYENDGNENFTAHTINQSGANSIYAIDVDGDEDIDVLSASFGDDQITWYENDGNENFAQHIITASASGANSVFAIDMEGDGDIDVLSASYYDNKIDWYENDGNENFTTHTITTDLFRALSVYAIDVDGDEDIDVLAASEYYLVWYENDGSENFTFHTINVPGVTINIYAADIDGDGDMDVVSGYDYSIIWYENLSAPIPVELTTFIASISKGKVTLNWSTATETNNSGFEVQRKLENSDWERIDFVNGHGTTTERQNYRFTDNINNLQTTSLFYRLKQIDYDGSYEYSEVVEVINVISTDYALKQNYPNPFNPSTTIKYSIPELCFVNLKIYDVLGNKITTLVNEEKQTGTYELTWYAESIPSGVYLYRLQAGDFIQTKKMVLLR